MNKNKPGGVVAAGALKWQVRAILAMGCFTVLLAGAHYLYYHSPGEGIGLACPVYALTGYHCPGCGAGRACYAILHGEFYRAFRYNPLLVLLLPWLGLYYCICGIQWLLYGEEKLSVHIPEWIPLVILTILLLYGAVRNIGMYPFTMLAPVEV